MNYLHMIMLLGILFPAAVYLILVNVGDESDVMQNEL